MSGEARLEGARERYVQLIELEALLVDTFEVIGKTPEIDVKEYRKDISRALQFVSHLKHREVGAITGINNNMYEEELPLVVGGDERKNEPAQKQQQFNNNRHNNKRRRR